MSKAFIKVKGEKQIAEAIEFFEKKYSGMQLYDIQPKATAVSYGVCGTGMLGHMEGSPAQTDQFYKKEAATDLTAECFPTAPEPIEKVTVTIYSDELNQKTLEHHAYYDLEDGLQFFWDKINELGCTHPTYRRDIQYFHNCQLINSVVMRPKNVKTRI